jgi:hypothetical protein
MRQLRSKTFTIDASKREAVNFYVWESEEAAKAFFTGEVLDEVSRIYGVRPEIELVQIAELVANAGA